MTFVEATLSLLLIASLAAAAHDKVHVRPSSDYYWREYNGIVPEDAIVATTDRIVPTFIGNGYVWDGGMYVAQIQPGVTHVDTTGIPPGNAFVHHVQKRIMILCTQNKDHYKWVKKNGSDSLDDKNNFVLGGHQGEQKDPLYIGRVTHAGVQKIGRVRPVNGKTGRIFFFETDVYPHEANWDSYEILTYQPPTIN